MKLRPYWVLVSFISLWLCQASFAQTLTIRVINLSDGQPLQGQRISVQPLYENQQGDNTTVFLMTDTKGEARITIHKPPPPHLDVRAYLRESRWYCGCWVMASTAQIMEKGYVSDLGDDAKSATERNLKPSPGEIVILARPTPWWVRLLYPIMKE